MRYENILREIYYTPGRVGSYAGVNPLFQEGRKHDKNLSMKQVKTWLSGQAAYALHKPARINFPRNKTVVSGIDQQWQADLIDVSKFSKENHGKKFILTVIDVLSKYAWAYPLASKSGSEVAAAFQKIFETGRAPRKIQTDAGKEFLNTPLKKLLARYGIQHFVTHSETKAAVIERFNRTLKNKLWRHFTARNTHRYVDILASVLQGYNDTYHRSIQTAPNTVNLSNERVVWLRLYGDILKSKRKEKHLKVGDHVRISRLKGKFEKGYQQTYTDEIFIIKELLTRGERGVYRLKDYTDEPVKGTFYPEELQKVPDDQQRVYRIEKVIKKRGRGKYREVLVKWTGWPDKFNSWVKEAEVQDL